MPAVARLGDPGSHGGAIISASPTTTADGKKVARVGDMYGCPRHGPNPITTGSNSFPVDNKKCAHVGSQTACGAIITAGSPKFFVD